MKAAKPPAVLGDAASSLFGCVAVHHLQTSGYPWSWTPEALHRFGNLCSSQSSDTTILKRFSTEQILLLLKGWSTSSGRYDPVARADLRWSGPVKRKEKSTGRLPPMLIGGSRREGLPITYAPANTGPLWR